jgi:hypothetical protein
MVLVRKNTRPNSKIQKKNQAQTNELGTTTDPKKIQMLIINDLQKQDAGFGQKKAQKGGFVRAF